MWNLDILLDVKNAVIYNLSDTYECLNINITNDCDAEWKYYVINKKNNKAVLTTSNDDIIKFYKINYNTNNGEFK